MARRSPPDVPRSGPTRVPTRPVVRRDRRHGAILEQPDRRDLEREGWRTTLEYRENLRRGRDGRLLEVQPVWRAEAERQQGKGSDEAVVIWAEAGSVDAAWARLRLEAELAAIRAGRRPVEPVPVR